MAVNIRGPRPAPRRLWPRPPAAGGPRPAREEPATGPRGDDWLFWDPENIHRYPDPPAGDPAHGPGAEPESGRERSQGRRIRACLAGDLLVYLAGVVAGVVGLAMLLVLLTVQQLRDGLETPVRLTAAHDVAAVDPRAAGLGREILDGADPAPRGLPPN